MMTSIHWWLRFVLWLLFGGALTSSVVIVVKSRLKKQFETKPFGSGWRRTLLVITGEGYARKMNSIYMVFIGMVVGWGSRSIIQTHQDLVQLQQSVANTFTLADVLVVQRQPPDRYLLETSAHQPFTLKFCSDRIPEWDENSKLKVLIYEQKPECASISMKTGKLGYLVYRDENGAPLKFLEAGVRYERAR